MTSEQEHRRTELKKYLENAFPPDYWEEFAKEFGHNFFNAHLDRTLEYDQVLNEKIASKYVLEVGGFPGLETAWLINCLCQVHAIDSPNYVPEYYSKWIKAHSEEYSHPAFNSEWDIVTGEPVGDVCQGPYDVCIMSDVLLHVEGFPSDFMKYVIKNCEDIYLINYPGDSKITPVKEHNLHSRYYSIPSNENLKEWMEDNGAKFVETISLESGRQLNVFKGAI